MDRDEDADKYHEAYMAAMEGRRTSDSKQKSSRGKRKAGKRNKKSEQESSTKKDDLPDDFPWQNTEETTRLWNMINKNDLEGLQNWIDIEPYVVSLRSEDGRGPLWWRHTNRRERAIISLLPFFFL